MSDPPAYIPVRQLDTRSRMTDNKDRLLWEPQIGDFRALVLHLTAVVLLLTHSCGGQLPAINTSQPMVAMVGDDITLPCHLHPAVDATDLTVEWARPDLDPRFVHLRRDGVELLSNENPLFQGRTSLSPNLKCGDVSLKLSQVKLSDAGSYRCLIPTSGTESVVELTVGFVSSPDIKVSKVSSGVKLECESGGWYPEPEVLWLDAEGNLLPAGPTETVRGPDDLYTVSSRVTVEKRHSNSFTCRVQQKSSNQTRETRIHVPDDLFMVQSSSAVRIMVCVAPCIMSVVAVVFIMWKWGPNKTKTEEAERKTKATTSGNSTEYQLLMEGEGGREQLRTGSDRMTYLDKTKNKLDEDLQKNEGDLQHVLQLITTLTDQKKHLKIQREKLISLQQEDKIQIEENKRKLKTTPKMDKDNKMKKREKTKEDLERRKTEHDNLLQNTEKLLETTEEMMIRMTERKGTLERDKEQMNKHLKETQRPRDELQKKLQSEREEQAEKKLQSEREEQAEKKLQSEREEQAEKKLQSEREEQAEKKLQSEREEQAEKKLQSERDEERKEPSHNDPV